MSPGDEDHEIFPATTAVVTQPLHPTDTCVHWGMAVTYIVTVINSKESAVQKAVLVRIS